MTVLPVGRENARCVDGVLVCGAALAAAGLVLVAPWEVVATGALILAMLVRRARSTAIVLAVVLLAAGALRARSAVKAHEGARAAADAALGLPKRCTARARVVSSPVVVRGTLRWDGAIEDAACDEAAATWSGVATLYGGPADLARGDEAIVVATLGAPQRLWDASGGDPRPGEAHRGVARSGGTLDVVVTRRASGLLAWIDRVRARVRARIDATFAPDLAPMARALVLGESDLAPDDDRSVRASGLSHLLAVSGMHLVLVLALVVRGLEGVLVRVETLAARLDVGRVAAAVGIPVAWLYAELAG
ncbi:MAG TPA: ComEC/Rec2 family competence protein, partial [Polyangiaceae bacterium]|nr:ComEC/Rec2 family competence protein [Polyangiaceae bacterium]